MKYLIVGCGPAGAFAAKNLRTLLPEAQITLLDSSERGLYARMRLPEYLSGSLPEAKLILSGPDAFEKLNIHCCFGKKALSIVRTGKRLLLEDGESIPYDTLILATGADAFVPPVEGVAQCRHYVLRSLEDAAEIRSRCCSGLPRGILIVGGGLLGLEAASSLTKCSVPVTVAECSDRLLRAQFTEKGSVLLQKRLEELGISFHLQDPLSSVREEGDGTIHCTFTSGKVLKCSLLLFSAGIRPRTALAASSGLEIGRGIKVNDHLQTGDESIYAIGDCAEYKGQIPGLWLAARDQAMALSSILAGKQSIFEMPAYKPEPKISSISLKEIREAEI